MRGFHIAVSVKRHARLLGSLLLASVLLPVSFTSNTVLADGTIETSTNISNTSSQSEAPSISLGGNRLGVSWGERDSNSIGTVRATVDGSFGERSILNTGSKTKQQWPDVAVDASGTMHLTYAAGNSIFYRRKPVGGSWSSAISVGSDNFPNPVRIAVGSNGRIWVIWRDGDGTKIGFRFSDNGGAGWNRGSTGGVVAAQSGNMIGIDIAIGPDSNPHVVWYLKTSGSEKGEIEYADWDGTRFRSGNITNDGSGLYDADPVTAIDKSGVQHVAFRKQLSSSGTSWGITYARRNPGGNWTGFTQLAATRGDAKYTPGIGVDETGSVYVAYSEPFGNSKSRQIVLLSKPAGQTSWARQTISNGRWDYAPAIAGSSSTGLKAHIVYQTEPAPDKGDIIYTRVRFAGGVVINADPTLDANTPFTRNSSVTLTFSAVQGGPTEMRWRWGAIPTDQANDSSGWQPFQTTRQIPLPVPEGGCGALTLYTQVRAGSNVQQEAQSDSITYDANVEASVAALNPNTSGLTSSYADGANDGSGGYTRETAYNFVLNGADDCGGLKSYKINTGPETAVVGDGAFFTNLPFAAQASGLKTIDVVVTDNAGNQATFNRSILLDLPADGKPVVAAATVAITDGNTLAQSITVANAQVSDNLYGTAEGLPADKEFWGVLVATSRTQIPTAEVNATAGLAWTPLRVQNPAASSFTVNYNVTSGLNVNGLSGAAGTYYVYLKFIDGAGNPSEWTSDALPVTLAAGYSVPGTPLPLISFSR